MGCTFKAYKLVWDKSKGSKKSLFHDKQQKNSLKLSLKLFDIQVYH